MQPSHIPYLIIEHISVFKENISFEHVCWLQYIRSFDSKLWLPLKVSTKEVWPLDKNAGGRTHAQIHTDSKKSDPYKPLFLAQAIENWNHLHVLAIMVQVSKFN